MAVVCVLGTPNYKEFFAAKTFGTLLKDIHELGQWPIKPNPAIVAMWMTYTKLTQLGLNVTILNACRVKTSKDENRLGRFQTPSVTDGS
ncbi:MAG: hypothetical protein LBJ61_01605 [Deltaproteobacteria bacterium]|jgi:hypothetical protein|nr:hypothetical protein [Deltaproteobacteria bacterium]